ncbi:MAG: PAQR family membrane homeostasis protein TrhA [Ignavibacteriales bacterium]
MFSKLRDPVSGLSHFVGVLLSIAALVVLIVFSAIGATPWHVVSFSIFGTALILLYSASSLYHLLPLSEKGITIFRKIDHIMIFVLIAGSYTPICLVPIRGAWGWSLFGIIWVLTIAGLFMKLFWLHAPRWLYTSIYLLMGWMVAIAFVPLVKALPMAGIWWLVAGGLFYSVGAVIYGLKKPNFAKYFGFHEIFHIFIMLGSFCHFWLMFKYVMYVKL